MNELKMDSLLAKLYSRRLPKGLRQSIDFFFQMNELESQKRMHPLDVPPNSRMLSLSPHSDDDIFGWGGLLHQRCRMGEEVVSVVVTDGSKGGGTLYLDERELVELRKQEARDAAAVLGIHDVRFWNGPDSRLQCEDHLLDSLHALWLEFRPTVVVLPSVLDEHPDHRATAELLARYLEKRRNLQVMCLQGEIWTPLPYWNVFLSVDAEADLKLRAIGKFVTQLAQADFLEASEGLMRYRALSAIQQDRFVECFLASSGKEYVRLWKIINHNLRSIARDTI